jgi:hypothetical protein
MEDLISRVAAYRRGLAFVHLGDTESVAVQLGVHPFVVAEAKEILGTDDGRRRMLEKVREAQEKHPRPLQCPPAWPVVAACPESPHGVRELIRAAENGPGGLEFLTDGSPESVAVTFHVHPDLVFRARDVIQRWKARMEAHDG